MFVFLAQISIGFFFFFLPQKTVVKDDCAPSLPMFLC